MLDPSACDLLVDELTRSCELTERQAWQLRAVFASHAGEMVRLSGWPSRPAHDAAHCRQLARTMLDQRMAVADIRAALMTRLGISRATAYRRIQEALQSRAGAGQAGR